MGKQCDELKTDIQTEEKKMHFRNIKYLVTLQLLFSGLSVAIKDAGELKNVLVPFIDI